MLHYESMTAAQSEQADSGLTASASAQQTAECGFLFGIEPAKKQANQNNMSCFKNQIMSANEPNYDPYIYYASIFIIRDSRKNRNS